jgi:hypothetical protein
MYAGNYVGPLAGLVSVSITRQYVHEARIAWSTNYVTNVWLVEYASSYEYIAVLEVKKWFSTVFSSNPAMTTPTDGTRNSNIATPRKYPTTLEIENM